MYLNFQCLYFPVNCLVKGFGKDSKQQNCIQTFSPIFCSLRDCQRKPQVWSKMTKVRVVITYQLLVWSTYKTLIKSYEKCKKLLVLLFSRKMIVLGKNNFQSCSIFVQEFILLKSVLYLQFRWRFLIIFNVYKPIFTVQQLIFFNKKLIRNFLLFALFPNSSQFLQPIWGPLFWWTSCRIHSGQQSRSKTWSPLWEQFSTPLLPLGTPQIVAMSLCLASWGTQAQFPLSRETSANPHSDLFL